MNDIDLMQAKIDDVGEVTDVRQATLRYILSHPEWYVSMSIVVFLGLCLSIYTSYFPILIFSAVTVIVLYAIVFNKMTEYLMRQFADSLGYSYTSRGEMTSVFGSLFTIGHRHSISHVLSGRKEDHPVRIFLYSYVVGQGKNSRTYRYTVFEKTFDCIVPHVLVHKPELFFSDDVPVFSNSVDITLEGNFNKYFSLAVEKDFEMEAYQIFTPDIMEELIETSKTFGFEFIQNRLYVYTPKFIGTRAELDTMFALSEKLCKKLEPVLHGMEDDITAVKERMVMARN
jgi:hypothetical protein